ncbi:MAG: hypothetical protein K2Q45_00440 [Nitrosomonas sp.]|nr:hypothetical protein [Nitrosomonas sp.]
MKNFWIVVAVIFIVLAFVTTLVATVFVAKQDSLFRICFSAVPQNVIGGTGGEPNAVVIGMITLDQYTDKITYIMQTVASMSGVTAVHIRGPIPLGGSIGPLYAALCGFPNNDNACDISTLPGQLSGTVLKVYDGIVPEATSIRNVFEDIRANPFLYYVEILTNAKPVTPGAVRANIVATCGFA